MSKSILIVDDEPNIVLSLEFLLEMQGFAVQSAYDGEEALKAISECPPDLVLLDINMPKLNGYEVCAAVRANPKWDAVRILILTAKGRDVEREKGLAMGADEYVTKPFSTHEVVEKVHQLLGSSMSPE